MTTAPETYTCGYCRMTFPASSTHICLAYATRADPTLMSEASSERSIKALRAEIARLTAALSSAEERAREAVEVLRSVEWSQKNTRLKNGGTIYTAECCPVCQGEKDPPPNYTKYPEAVAGHAAGCALAALLETKGVDRG